MTLLEKAKSVRSIRARQERVSYEELELCVAFMTCEINGTQVSKALGISNTSNVYGAVTTMIRRGVAQGLVTVELKRPNEQSSALDAERIPEAK